MTKLENYVIHRTSWYWGICFTLIRNDGTAMVKFSFCDESEVKALTISDLLVHESVRRKGYAKDLLSYAEDFAKELELSILYLCVQDDQDWLISWYKRLGFVIFDHDKDEGIYRMIKNLK